MYKYTLSTSPINILICAGIHGNEPAGTYTLIDLIRQNYFNLFNGGNIGNIYILPYINVYGLNRNIRSNGRVDMNRCFGSGNKGCDVISHIYPIISYCSIILDLHEGWGYHLINGKSMGSTISYLNCKDLANYTSNAINAAINDHMKKFTTMDINDNNGPYGSLMNFISKYYPEKTYLLLETTGQNDIQPLHIRQQQVFIFLHTLLRLISKK